MLIQIVTSLGISGILSSALLAAGVIDFGQYFALIIASLAASLLPDISSDNRQTKAHAFALLGLILGLICCSVLMPEYGLIASAAAAIAVFCLFRFGLFSASLHLLRSHGAFESLTLAVLTTEVSLIISHQLLLLSNTMTALLGLFAFYGYVIRLLIGTTVSNNTGKRHFKSLKLIEFKVWWLYLILYIVIVILYWFTPDWQQLVDTLKHSFTQINLWWS
ncbi:MAG: hypothetical protein ACO2ZM_04565 [Francisellaceae bacterium]